MRKIEVVNVGDEPVSLHGYRLSEDAALVCNEDVVVMPGERVTMEVNGLGLQLAGASTPKRS